jgi:hypothetical protein
MTEENYLGKNSNDIPAEKLEELLKKGYSISPNSGRLRKRIKQKKKPEKLSKKKLNKIVQKVGWFILLILFLISIVMMIPHIGDNRAKNKSSKTR